MVILADFPRLLSDRSIAQRVLAPLFYCRQLIIGYPYPKFFVRSHKSAPSELEQNHVFFSLKPNVATSSPIVAFTGCSVKPFEYFKKFSCPSIHLNMVPTVQHAPIWFQRLSKIVVVNVVHGSTPTERKNGHVFLIAKPSPHLSLIMGAVFVLTCPK